MAAYLHSSRRSDPENPHDFSASFNKSTSSASIQSFKITFKMSWRYSSSGIGTSNCNGSRLRIASSMDSSRLDAARIIIWFSAFVVRPSHCCRNIAFNEHSVDWSSSVRMLRNESISSMKIIHGSSFRARVNRALASFSVSPMNLFLIIDISRFMKLASIYLAIAFATKVLPHPGGP